MTFVKAQRKRAKLRLGLVGPSGSGKTWTALAIASGMVAPGKRIAVIDSERESASLYANNFDFDVCALKAFAPADYVKALHEAERDGYDVVVIDSLSHAWNGTGGALEMVDAAMARSRGNKFAAWREVTPEHNDLVNAMLQSPAHVITTMRAVTEYVLEADEKGKQVPKKVGLKPVQRDGMEYEFTTVLDIGMDHTATASKDRTGVVGDKAIRKPGAELGQSLISWLNSGAEDNQLTVSSGGVSLLSPPVEIGARAASNEPSKGGATLPVSTREVVAAVAAALPDGSGEWLDLDKLKALTKAFAAPEMLGEAAVREIAKGFGEPKKRTPEQWDAFRRALETRWQETLNNASTFRWDLYVKELGEKVTDEIAAMVSDHEGQPPEDWTAEQLLRALRAAEKRQKDVPQ